MLEERYKKLSCVVYMKQWSFIWLKLKEVHIIWSFGLKTYYVHAVQVIDRNYPPEVTSLYILDSSSI